MSKLQNWLQIGANVGILIGLILVGGQIYQSNTIAAAELFSDNLESTIVREIGLFGESPEQSMARLLFDHENAQPHDFFVADRVYSVIYRQLVRASVLSNDGLYGNSEVINAQGFVNVNYHLFACPYGIAWLDQIIERARSSNPLMSAFVQMRDLAVSRLASEAQGDRISRANELAKKLDALRDSASN